MNKSLVRSTFDDALDALADVQRRRLLLDLLDHNPDDTSTFTDDADARDSDVEHRIAMEHLHLPKLTEYGFVEWNEDSHEVSRGPNFDEISPLLELLDDHEDELPDGWL